MTLNPEDESLNQAVDSLMDEKRLQGQVSEGFQAAVKLKTSGQAPKMRREFDEKMERKLLSLFAEEKQPSLWKVAFGSSFAGVAMVAVMAIVILFNPVDTSTSVQTLADVQNLESLSRAEILLGALPQDAITDDGIPVSEIRSLIHEINSEYAEADTTLDPNLELFPHVQLRDNALEVIEMESDFFDTFNEQTEEDFVEETRIIAFSGKVGEWPTTNEGVSFEIHAQAVNGYLTHQDLWEQATYELALQITEGF